MFLKFQPGPFDPTSKAVKVSTLIAYIEGIEVGGIIFMWFRTEGTILQSVSCISCFVLQLMGIKKLLHLWSFELFMKGYSKAHESKADSLHQLHNTCVLFSQISHSKGSF